LGGIVVLCATLLASASARADQRVEARSHFRKGMSAIAEGHYEAGIEELKAAYEILPHPNVLYNIARAYGDMGDLENAISYYRKYLDGAPKDRDEVAKVVDALEERLAKQQAMLNEAEQSAPAPAPANGEPAAAVPAPKPAPLPPPSPGLLKTDEVFEETVVTASKAAQSPLDAPSSTSIITEQDIRLSGITKVPELLRRLAGVDIMETTGSQTEVSMRGFNQRLSNKVLILMDGRSVYIDLLGATLWASLPLNVEDIERIEVVRGPGSALYGADAFNGVINIITKAPGEGRSGAAAAYGDRNAAHGAVWVTGRAGDLAYRVSGGYDYLPRWSREVPPGATGYQLFTPDQDASERGEHILASVTRAFGNDVTVRLDGGYTHGFFELLGVGPINDEIIQGDSTQASISLDSRHFEARVFWNYQSSRNGSNSAQFGQSLQEGLSLNNVVDGEMQYVGNFELGRGVSDDLHVGADYRLKNVSWTYLGATETEHHFGAFLHDELKIGTRLALVGDYRADYVPYLRRVVQSPRGSVLVHPTARSTIRGSVGTAFRTPTFLESYIGYTIQLPVTGAALTTPQQYPKVQPEQVFTAELGYMNSDSDYFSFDGALFRNHVSNLIEVSPNQAVSLGDIASGNVNPGLNPSANVYPLFLGGFDNQCQRYDVYGAEVGVRVFPVEGLDIYGNYTLMSVNQDDTGCSALQQAALVTDARTSAHKVNAGVQLRTKPGIDGEIDFHYVSPQDWAEQVTNVEKQQIEYQSFHLAAYTLVNARLGYRFFRDHAEISVVGFNVLGDKHREHPFGQVVDRRVMGMFSYKF
jgi:iron complex outermembrane receptor protein